MSQRHLGADAHLSQLSEIERSAALGSDHDIADVVCVFEQADAAHVVTLLTNLKIVGAHVRVTVADRGHHLRHRDSVSDQFVRVEIDVKLLGRTTKAHYIDDAGDLFELSFENPVLRHLELHHAMVLANQLIAADLTDGRPGRQLWWYSWRQRDRLQPVEDFLPVLLVIAFKL